MGLCTPAFTRLAETAYTVYQMDALHISGKWYISSRRAAKEHGYHVDYIGQLIRTGKVKGQKVGRAWYVLADSLSDYLEKEGNAPSPKSSAVRAKALERASSKAKSPALKIAVKVPEPEPEEAEEEQDEIVEEEEEVPVPEISTPAVAAVAEPEAKPEPEPEPEPIPASEVFEEVPLPEHAPKTSLPTHGLLTYLRDEEPTLSDVPAALEPASIPKEDRDEIRIPIHATVKRFNEAVTRPLKRTKVAAPRPPEYRRLETSPAAYARHSKSKTPAWIPLAVIGSVAFAATLGLSIAISSTIGL